MCNKVVDEETQIPMVAEYRAPLKRTPVIPGAVPERTYFAFVVNQVAYELRKVEDAVAAIRRRQAYSDAIDNAIRGWKSARNLERRDTLQTLLSQPYHGRIDFVEDK